MKLFLLAAAFAAAPLSAQVPAPAPAISVAVNAAGLDLATVKGQRALDLRIVHAVSALCGTPSSADAMARAKLATCRSEAMASAAVARDRAVDVAQRKANIEIASSR